MCVLGGGEIRQRCTVLGPQVHVELLTPFLPADFTEVTCEVNAPPSPYVQYIIIPCHLVWGWRGGAETQDRRGPRGWQRFTAVLLIIRESASPKHRATLTEVPEIEFPRHPDKDEPQAGNRSNFTVR